MLPQLTLIWLYFQITKSSKKRLFQCDNLNTSTTSIYSTLQKSSLSNSTTLERSSPKPSNTSILKAQLEQRLSSEYPVQKAVEKIPEEPAKAEDRKQNLENKYQRLGIRVLPAETKMEQSNNVVLSQNDNNINLERHEDREVIKSIDEVDKNAPPPVKRREKVFKPATPEDLAEEEELVRQNSLNGSVRRDKNGIPQEIPNHMLNAAVAARKNRKSSSDELVVTDDMKSPKKLKGRAPAPPEEKAKSAQSQENLDQISPAEEEVAVRSSQPDDDVTGDEEAYNSITSTKSVSNDYGSDSDVETDNQSSVNTIELNSSDITIHQTEENDDMQNRRTASTGDLSKLDQRARKISNGTLERAQSLDITDTGMPVMSKKRKAPADCKTGSNDSLYGKVLACKEPRLSLALDGLNTFQRSRLKKSTEWGNLEDAIFNSSNDSNETSDKDAELDALVNKINEIKQGVPSEPVRVDVDSQEAVKVNGFEYQNGTADPEDVQENSNSVNVAVVEAIGTHETHFPNTIKIESSHTHPDNTEEDSVIEQSETTNSSANLVSVVPKAPVCMEAADKFITMERQNDTNDPYYLQSKMYDINASDDIKVSRNSLGSLETPECGDVKVTTKEPSSVSYTSFNISNVTIGDTKDMIENEPPPFMINIKSNNESFDKSEMYTTASEQTLQENGVDSIGYESYYVSPQNITLTDTNQVTIEGPTSLTLEINSGEINGVSDLSSESPKITSKNISISSPESNTSLTYITEIQVTPQSTKTNISEIEITPNVNAKNLDNEFETYVKNFESRTTTFDSPPPTIQTESKKPEATIETKPIKTDPEKELHKIQELVEEQLKKLPEMRFTTSTYEANKAPDRRGGSQIEQLRSNFERTPEKSPPKITKSDSMSKSRIPIATSKTPPTSPERRDSRNYDPEVST